MTISRREGGLSEAVGFILILAAVTIVLSVYLLYMMPAMGRENEIAQMSAVKDSLTEYKLNIDTLWTSRECTTDFGPALTLGSGQTGGILGFFPFLSPIQAGASLGLNQRNENITITSDSYVLSSTGGYTESRAVTTTPVNSNVNTTPTHLFINITANDLLLQHGILVDGPGWDVWVNITPNYAYTRRFFMTQDPVTGGLGSQGFWYRDDYVWNSTDITVNTYSGTTPIVNKLAVYRAISGSTTYPVDLMNPVYGISTQFQSPQSIWISKSDAAVTGTSLIVYGYSPTVTSLTMPLGDIEYRSNNIYYTPQTYYYQLGGVFLEQDDGSTMEIPPSVSLSMVNTSPVVRVGEILLQGSVTDSQVSGSGPITVTSAVTDIENTPLAAGNNTRWVNLTIQSSSVNASAMWLRTLRDIADRGGLPVTSYTNGSAGNVAFINITGNPQVYDVQLASTMVNVSADYVEEYSSGGISRSWRSVPGYAAPGYTTSATTVPTTTTTTTPTPTPTPNPPWYCGWAYRKNITIDKAKVVGGTVDPINNFPVLINLPSDSDLQTKALGSGDDILFTDSGGTNKIPHEIESYTSGNGALVAWVNVPSLSSSANSSIYMYYGNPSASNQQNPTGVWDTGYMAVWHLKELGVGGAGEFRDSTSNNNNGQGGAGAASKTPTRVNGKIGYGQSFARGSSQFINVPDNPGSLDPTGALTLEGWVNGATWLGGNSSIIGKGFGTKTQDTYAISETQLAGPSSVASGYLTTGGPRAGAMNTGTWYFVAMNYSSSGTATAYLFLNGAVVNSQAGLSISPDGNPVLLGAKTNNSAPAQFFDGILDELRISNVARKDNWIATEYNNENSPATFYRRNASESFTC